MGKHRVTALVLWLLIAAIPQFPSVLVYGQVVNVDDAVNELVNPFLLSTPTVGLSIGIIKDGTLHTYHFGEIEKGRRQPPTDSTLYAIGSVSKTFAGTVLAQAVVEGKVRLDDDIRMYLDGDYPNLEFQGQPIQLLHLVNHNAGLPFMLPVLDSVSPDSSKDAETERTLNERRALQGYTRQDFLEDLRRVELKSSPGSQFQYSNVGTQLLGYILEHVYGKPYEQLVTAKITEPLKMSSTKFVLSTPEAHRFKGYNGEGVAVPNNSDYMAAAGGVKSSVLDMLKYTQWHLHETDEAVRLTHQPTWSNGGIYSVGLNWQMFQLPAHRVIWQEGSLPGYSSYCVIYPELNLGIVALMNEFDPATSSQLTMLIKELTIMDPGNWTSE
jgi:CubicO group peptidase (beta-lactamase class C family)